MPKRKREKKNASGHVTISALREPPQSNKT
jgi:hypothetical protein